MANVRSGSRGRGPRLTTDFAGWIGGGHQPSGRFFREGLIVLDANILLELYRITPDARTQVLNALSGVASRLWVPYQAAEEFSRNRKRVVIDRLSSFKRTKQSLQSAVANAVDVLESAVEQLLYQRERNNTTRGWNPVDAGLDRDSMLARLDGLMNPALSELDQLAAEHDLHPEDLQNRDSVLLQIDELLDGRIGVGYTIAELRALVEEAHSFRFPNQIPPGFLDAGKDTLLRGAGDYILWRQTIDRAAQMTSEPRLVLMITGDLKADWWDLDEKKRPRGARPELAQELRNLAGADLLLLSLKDFMTGASNYLSSTVSEKTLQELRKVSHEVEEPLPEAFKDPAAEPDLLSLPIRDFERLIHYMLVQLGYSVDRMRSPGYDAGADFVLTDESKLETRTILVEVKRYRGSIGVREIRQLQGVLLVASAESALLITTGSFSAAARAAAETAPIQLIDGTKLLELLAGLGIRARIGIEQ